MPTGVPATAAPLTAASSFLSGALGLDAFGVGHLAEIALRLLAALVLGGLLAYRPWRLFLPRAFPGPSETTHAQMIIAVAGAVMVAVIGDSLARAFGLVGLGAFIRFRSGIKDPRDVAVMLVMIGIGMACGLALIPTAVLSTVFVATVLFVLDATGKAPPRRVRAGITAEDPTQVFQAVRAAFPGARAVEVPSPGTGPGKVVVELDAGVDTDAASVMEMLALKKVPGVKGVTLEDD